MTYILCLTCLHFASFIGRQAAILQTTKEDPALFLQRYRPPVLIDEIQKAPKLFPYIMEIVDASDQTGTVWLTGSQPFHLMKEVSESLAGHAGVIEMLGLSSAGISGVSSESFSPGRDYFVLRVTVSKPYDVAEAYDRICAGSLPGIRSLPKDLRAGAYESYLDTGLAAYLTGWTSPQALETGTMSGQVFETHVFGEIYKSFLNAGQQAPLYFFRNNDKKEIDLLMERDGTLFPHRSEEDGIAVAQRRAQSKRPRPSQCARRGARALDVQTRNRDRRYRLLGSGHTPRKRASVGIPGLGDLVHAVPRCGHTR